jgi:DNA-binding PadR family transcriptional regulator
MINQLLKNKEGMTPHQLHNQLKPVYGNEKQCNENAIDDHLMSMKGVGLVEVKNAVEDKDNNLVVTYAITEYGAARAQKYIAEFLI